VHREYKEQEEKQIYQASAYDLSSDMCIFQASSLNERES